MFNHIEQPVPLVFEPSLSATFLPRCAHCGGQHPLSYHPPLPADRCPDCGEPPVQPGDPVQAQVALTGMSPAMITARACLAIGKFLRDLAKGL